MNGDLGTASLMVTEPTRLAPDEKEKTGMVQNEKIDELRVGRTHTHTPESLEQEFPAYITECQRDKCFPNL